jgi:hypothetical protein
MYMMGHQDISMKVARSAPCRSSQDIQIGESIFVTKETDLAIITPLSDVLWNTGNVEPPRPWHDRAPNRT